MREVIPNKLITATTDTGIITDVVLHYKLKIDGILDKSFHTISVKDGIDIPALQVIVNAAIAQATASENPQ